MLNSHLQDTESYNEKKNDGNNQREKTRRPTNFKTLHVSVLPNYWNCNWSATVL